ncbi:hypothetical protein PENANT_c040G07442 [Penicillium antarcticum]|uniref:Methyltransferase domain-containing protein n=1 Tax=Penicillium antarcticum TaxID=416450 RepID=A0A1V6PSN7_9EURO|nr:hypothetical protein PENANT_c040G07442 [Penicillium antarcticum]
MASPDSQTIELDREFLDTVTFHGREYQKYSIDNRTYFGPVDEEEAERLEDEQQVTGVDIAPHMNPDDVPDNLWLQVDDLNRRFTFPSHHFDLVHSRLLATGIHRTRWPSYLRDIVRVLKPGGWAQMVEIYFNVQSDNGSLNDDHALRRWSTHYMRALDDRKDLRIGSKLRMLMTEAGFEEVDTKMIPLPLSSWGDARTQSIGRSSHENIKQLLRSLALYPLIQRLHMSPQSFEALVTQAQQEAADHTLKPYFPLYVPPH